MSEQELQFTMMDDLSLLVNIDPFEGNNTFENFDDITFSDGVFNIQTIDFSSLLADYQKPSENQCLGTYAASVSTLSTELISQSSDILVDNQPIISIGDEWEPDLSYIFNEEIVTTADPRSDTNEGSEPVCLGNDRDHFACIDGTMSVKEQPKPDPRARYESDGKRFLPDARKHPMSIQLPDLSAKALLDDETFGILLTIVTTTDNPHYKTFVHVNDIKYHTEDAIEIGHGRTFIPLNGMDIKNCEKLLPRLSIICKKLDAYDYDLTLFDTSKPEQAKEKYTLVNEDSIGKVAKSKQFIIDYKLFCYKIVCQLVFKKRNSILISSIQCETNVVNEEKIAKSIKRSASLNGRLAKRRKNSDSHYSTPENKFNGVENDLTAGNSNTARPRISRSRRSPKDSC